MQKVIQNARLANGLSRDELASVLGKSRWTVKAWEIGKRHPRTKDLGKLAQVLGVPVVSLIGEGE